MTDVENTAPVAMPETEGPPAAPLPALTSKEAPLPALTSKEAADKLAEISAQFKELSYICSCAAPLAQAPVEPALTTVASVSIKTVRLPNADPRITNQGSTDIVPSDPIAGTPELARVF